MWVPADQKGQASLTAALVLIGLVVAGAWIWNSLDYDTRDIIIEDVLPVGFLILAGAVVMWLGIRKMKSRKYLALRKQRLIQRLQAEPSSERRLDLAFTLVELNGYELYGLEAVASILSSLFHTTLKTSIEDKQHRIRGMAASYLGAIQDRTAIPLLLKALEDDHAYVRGCAALALGRMRVAEAKEKLTYVMKEDWDQTVRSRAREALERLA